MTYSCIKIIHVVSAALLLTSMAYCYKLWRLYAQGIINNIQRQTALVIIPLALFQLATGFTMISLQHYNYTEMWIKGSVIGFMIVVTTWFAFVYSLLSENHSERRPRQLQFAMLLICTLSLLSMVFFMANRVT